MVFKGLMLSVFVNAAGVAEPEQPVAKYYDYTTCILLSRSLTLGASEGARLTKSNTSTTYRCEEIKEDE